MNVSLLTAILRSTMRIVPEAIPHLSPRSRLALSEQTPYKTYEFFLSAIYGLVNGVYFGHMGGIFIDTLANLISGQLTDAFMRAWADEGHFSELPDYLNEALEDMILTQYEHVDQFYRDIVDARVDETPIAPLLQRAELWAQRWTEAYNRATALIVEVNGGRLQWKLGATETHCTTCAALDGIVAYAREWNELGVHPQGAPNNLIECGGWKCDCVLKPTDRRRSPKAFETIMNIVSK